MDEKTNSPAPLLAALAQPPLFTALLREKYFLAVQCTRMACSKIIPKQSYTFCPQCGQRMEAVYDYYKLLALPQTALGIDAPVEEDILKQHFRRLSQYYHPDSQYGAVKKHSQRQSSHENAPNATLVSNKADNTTSQDAASHHPELAGESAQTDHLATSSQQSASSAAIPVMKEHLSEEQLAASHENFTFLTAALETLQNKEKRNVYYKRYRRVLEVLAPEHALFLPQIPLSSSAPPPPAPKTMAEKFKIFFKGILKIGIFVSDLLLVGLIIFLVSKAYLWGAVLSLVGSWFYFRKTRRILTYLA